MASRGKIIKLLLVMDWVIFCAAGRAEGFGVDEVEEKIKGIIKK